MQSCRYSWILLLLFILKLSIINFSVTWSPGSSWPFNSWVIVCFSGLSSFLYRNVEFTFPDLSIDLFPLTLIWGWPKYSCKSHASMHIYQSVFHNLCIGFCQNFHSMTDYIHFPMNSASTQTINYSEKSQHCIHISISIS